MDGHHGASAAQPQLLGNIATFSRGWDPAIISHYTVQRVIDVDCAVSGRDLGGVAAAVQREIDRLGKLPAGTKIVIRGQSQAMNQSFRTLGLGVILAIVLVYLLMVANFQSWLEPFIITMAVPGALAGVLWMLVATGTTINVESLMGTIMAVGVGVANGNLLITFANELREEGLQSGRRRDRSGPNPPASDHHDRAGDDSGDAADGAGTGLGLRAERAAWAARSSAD